MRKALEESKRSVHSTRIDVVLGDPVPIKAASVLPVNPITRPEVEDPEYLPDTVSELSASLSALARLVPQEKVSEIYRTIRDVIDRIAPVTRTSLDLATSLSEAHKLTDDEKNSSFETLERIAGTIVTAVKEKMRHYRTTGTKYGSARVYELELFLDKIVKAVSDLEKNDNRARQFASDYEQIEQKILKDRDASIDKILKDRDEAIRSSRSDKKEISRLQAAANSAVSRVKNEADAALRDASVRNTPRREQIKKERGEILQAFFDLKDDLRDEMAASAFELPTRQVLPARALKRAIDEQAALSDENKREILDAFDHRIRELRASGDTFDAAVAIAVSQRKKSVEALLEKEDKFTQVLYDEITKDLGDLSSFRMEATSIRGKKYDIHLEPLFAPGQIRAVLADDDDKPVPFDPEGFSTSTVTEEGQGVEDMRYLRSSRYVHVYRRFLQMFDGSEIEVRPDVRINFDLIKSDCIDDAAEDLAQQGVSDALKKAEQFYEENKYYIIKDALHPSRGTISVKLTSGKNAGKIQTRSRTPERAALLLANQKIDDFRDLIDDKKLIDEPDVLKRARQEALRLADEGMSEEEIFDALTTQNLRIKEDEIRRVSRSATINRGAVRDRRDMERESLTQAIRGVLTQASQISPGGALIPSGDAQAITLELRQSAFDSFKAVASGDQKILAERGVVGVDTVRSFSASKIASSRASMNAAGKSAVSIAKKIDTSAKDAQKNPLKRSLISALISICDIRNKTLDKALDEVGDSISDESNDFIIAREQAIAALTDVEKKARAISASPESASVESIINLFLSIADKVTDAQDAEDERVLEVALSQIIETGIGGVFDRAIEIYKSDGDERASDTANIVGYSANNIKTHVVRIAADLTKRLPGATQDLTRLVPAAFDLYGLSSDQLPIFFSGMAGKKEALLKFAQEQQLNVSIVPVDTADVLFGVPGVGRQVLQRAESFGSTERAFSVLFDSSYVMSKAFLQDISSEVELSEENYVPVLRAIVNIACIVVFEIAQESAKGTQGSASSLSPMLIEQVNLILSFGKGAPTVRVLSFVDSMRKAVYKAVSVDLQEIGVGTFVDIAGSQVVRVVGLPKPGEESRFFSFIDPTLQRDFVGAHRRLTNVLEEKLKLVSAERKEHAHQEALRHLVVQLQDAAAAVNVSGNLSPSSVNKLTQLLGKAKSPEEIRLKTQMMQEKMRDRSATPYTRTVARAVLNYIESTGRDPGDELPFFTPVRSTRREDPDTGARLSRSNYDFVYRTLPIDAASLEPSLEQMPLSITPEYMSKVYKLIDLHVLTDINNVFGSVRYGAERSKKKGGKSSSKQSEILASTLARQETTMTPALSAGVSILRSPEKIRNLMVLTLNSSISPDLIYDKSTDPDVAKDSIKSMTDLLRDTLVFLIKLMLKSSGYKKVLQETTKEEGEEKKAEEADLSGLTSSSLLQIAAKRKEHFNEKANRIIDEALLYVGRQIEKVTGRISTVEVTDLMGVKRTVQLTPADVAARNLRLARGSILQKIGGEYYESIGLSRPVTIKVDPTTGYLTLPPSPKDFFEEEMRGIPSSPSSPNYDPILYITKASEVMQKYREVLIAFGILDASDSAKKVDQFTQALKELSDKFPAIVEDIRARANKRLEGKSVPSIDQIEFLKLVMLGGKPPQIEGKPDIKISDTQQLISSLERIKKEVAKSAVQYDQVQKQLDKLHAIVRADAVLLRLQNFQRVAEKNGIVKIPVLQSDAQPTMHIGYFVDTFNECAEILNESSELVHSQIALMIAGEVDDVYDEDIIAACNSARSSLSDLVKRGQNVDENGKRIDELDKITARFKKEDKGIKEKDVFQIPKITQLSADLTEEMTETYKLAVERFTRARTATSKALAKATAETDREIEALAKGAVKFIASKTGADVKWHDTVIFDTVDNMHAFRSQLETQVRASLIRKENLSKEARDQIDHLTQLYVRNFLAEKIFGVRYLS